MIFFDVTKTGGATHRSGLTRVSARLRDGLGAAATEIAWDTKAQKFNFPPHAEPQPTDWIFTAELFSEEERPGFSAFLEARPCRLAAIFHDAIPLKHPHITWPQSVARHPAYLKLLARFDRIWAVSQASGDELLGFWKWQEVSSAPAVEVIALGADFNGRARVTLPAPASGGLARVLAIGIIEPRKNQTLLLDAAEELWREGVKFELHVVGRINPHFGPPIVTRLHAVRRQFPALLHFHEAAPDSLVAQLYASARATAFPTIAEGCGLPLLESLWMGVPCVCSDLPVLRENADGGGCLIVARNDRAAWKEALRKITSDEALRQELARAATTRPLPTWADAARTLATALR